MLANIQVSPGEDDPFSCLFFSCSACCFPGGREVALALNKIQYLLRRAVWR
jgi:hypothetical protein